MQFPLDKKRPLLLCFHEKLYIDNWFIRGILSLPPALSNAATRSGARLRMRCGPVAAPATATTLHHPAVR
jgi:hypothetical protein